MRKVNGIVIVNQWTASILQRKYAPCYNMTGLNFSKQKKFIANKIQKKKKIEKRLQYTVSYELKVKE